MLFNDLVFNNNLQMYMYEYLMRVSSDIELWKFHDGTKMHFRIFPSMFSGCIVPTQGISGPRNSNFDPNWCGLPFLKGLGYLFWKAYKLKGRKNLYSLQDTLRWVQDLLFANIRSSWLVLTLNQSQKPEKGRFSFIIADFEVGRFLKCWFTARRFINSCMVFKQAVSLTAVFQA